MYVGCLNVQRALNNLVNALNHGRLAGEVLQVLNKLVVVNVKGAKAINFILFITLNIKLKCRFYIRCHTELKLDLFASGQMEGFFDEIILRPERGERNTALCQRQRDNVVIEKKVFRQAFDNDRFLWITGLFRDRDIQLFAEVLDYV